MSDVEALNRELKDLRERLAGCTCIKHHMRETIAERLERYVDKSSGSCWLWTGTVKPPANYGVISARGRQKLVHRVSYELHRGPIPHGKVLDHLCRVRHCINPAHLEPVDYQTNTVRGVSTLKANWGKTQCKNGHLFDEENTIRRPQGGRRCRACSARWEREARERKKLEAKERP